MARLVDNYHMDEKIMKDIASHEFLVNVQQLVRSIMILFIYCYKCCLGLFNIKWWWRQSVTVCLVCVLCARNVNHNVIN